jgi:hypothetical protein
LHFKTIIPSDFDANSTTVHWSSGIETVKGISESLAVAPIVVDGHSGNSTDIRRIKE